MCASPKVKSKNDGRRPANFLIYVHFCLTFPIGAYHHQANAFLAPLLVSSTGQDSLDGLISALPASLEGPSHYGMDWVHRKNVLLVTVCGSSA